MNNILASGKYNTCKIKIIYTILKVKNIEINPSMAEDKKVLKYLKQLQYTINGHKKSYRKIYLSQEVKENYI